MQYKNSIRTLQLLGKNSTPVYENFTRDFLIPAGREQVLRRNVITAITPANGIIINTSRLPNLFNFSNESLSTLVETQIWWF